MKSKIRAASETHICDPEVCQAGVCAVGAQYVVELIPKGESTSVLERKGLVAFLKEKGWSGFLAIEELVGGISES